MPWARGYWFGTGVDSRAVLACVSMVDRREFIPANMPDVDQAGWGR